MKETWADSKYPLLNGATLKRYMPIHKHRQMTSQVLEGRVCLSNEVQRFGVINHKPFRPKQHWYVRAPFNVFSPP